MLFDGAIKDRLLARLQSIYGQVATSCLARLLELMHRYRDVDPGQQARMWDQRDVILITYGDQIRSGDRPPLRALNDFMANTGLDRRVNTIHLLPFYPYTSDDGFSVVDYRAVDPQLGTWNDILQLGKHEQLMFDLVLNHVSQSSEWFQQYLAGNPKYANYFIEMDPSTDLSAVTRPRSLPLLTPFETSRGTRHLWTTFSADQIDLNYANPDVLLAVLDVLLFYIRQGAKFIRLDAIAYLWKEIGTRCIHLPRTHAVVKLFRDVVDILAPHVVLLTETNVPHNENVSYFGSGDEAQMVYQFSLPPLLLDALLHHDARPFDAWLESLGEAPPHTTFLNFTASHDGIGVRPLEGLVSNERFLRLVEAVRRRGGLIGTRQNEDGVDTPYELNITYVDALSEPGRDDPRAHASRFLASQAIMLALRGIPAVYFHSLVGTRNDLEGVQESNIPRRINRRKFTLDELTGILSQQESLAALIHAGYRQLLGVRIEQAAFHPEGPQRSCNSGDPAVITFLRISPDGKQKILVAANLSNEPKTMALADQVEFHGARDLLSDRSADGNCLRLTPYEVVWLEAR